VKNREVSGLQNVGLHKMKEVLFIGKNVLSGHA
jgi:hypothetical protein